MLQNQEYFVAYICVITDTTVFFPATLCDNNYNRGHSVQRWIWRVETPIQHIGKCGPSTYIRVNRCCMLYCLNCKSKSPLRCVKTFVHWWKSAILGKTSTYDNPSLKFPCRPGYMCPAEQSLTTNTHLTPLGP